MSSGSKDLQPPKSRHKAKVPWAVILHKQQEPQIKKTDKGVMLIPKPLDVDALMKKVRKGRNRPAACRMPYAFTRWMVTERMTERCFVTTPTPMWLWLAYVLVCQQPLLRKVSG